MWRSDCGWQWSQWFAQQGETRYQFHTHQAYAPKLTDHEYPHARSSHARSAQCEPIRSVESNHAPGRPHLRLILQASLPATIQRARWHPLQRWDGQTKKMNVSLPCLPGCISCLPEGFQLPFITQCVHTLPKILMAIGIQLSNLCELFEYLSFQICRIGGDVVQNGWFHHH